MRILVTGALGTLGRPLVAELRGRGHEVWGCDRLHSGDEQFIRADVAEARQMSTAFDRALPEYVYHLAAEFGRHNGEDFYEDLWTTGAIGTRHVLELSRIAGARVAFASSSEIYGESKEDLLVEDAQNLWPTNEYALSKWANEAQVVNFQKRYGLDAVRLRFFNAYGPGEHYTPYRSVVSLFCHKALAGEGLPVYEGYHRTFQYIDDFTPTLANVCEADLKHEVYNIGGTDYRSVEDLARLVWDHIVPGETGTGSITGGIDLIPEDLHNIRSKRPDISRAREDLGHQPEVKLEEGVPATLDWMRSLTSYREGVIDG